MSNKLTWILGFALAIVLIGLAALIWQIVNSPYIAHPLGYCAGTPVQIRDCRGYNLWSGIVSDIGEITLVGGVLTLVVGFWSHHNCHQKGCPWLSWHPDENGHPVCKKHHSDPHGYLG